MAKYPGTHYYDTALCYTRFSASALDYDAAYMPGERWHLGTYNPGAVKFADDCSKAPST